MLLSVLALTPALLIIGCYLIINPSGKFVRNLQSVEPTTYGLVLGAGINSRGEPYDELKARLDVAAKALNENKVEVLILSGDNRFENYNEPEAMKQYLLEKGIEEKKLQADYAGRSTYESCERASKVFGVKRATIFSAGSHLPRAIFLCRHFGVEAYGVPSGVEANNSTRRESLARVKAIYNAYLIGERTVY